MGRDGVQKHRVAGTLIWKQREKLGETVWEPYAREFAPKYPVRPYPTIWSDLPTMRQAKAMLRDIFDTSDLFSTPKPVELIERMLRMIDDSDAVILDFFAGSGTTAQAVLNLNREDGGNRKFILVSSTEATNEAPDKNLCRDVCAERVRRVITGYTNKKEQAVDGLGGGFAYLRCRRIPAATVFRGIQHAQVWTALQLIHDIALLPYQADLPMQSASGQRGLVIYLPKLTESILAAVERASHSAGQAVVPKLALSTTTLMSLPAP